MVIKSFCLTALRILLLLLISSLSGFAQQLTLGISKENPAKNYGNWLQHHFPEAKLINFSALAKDSVLFYTERINGLLLSGGEDISTSIYGELDANKLCEEHNVERDSLELLLIRQAIKRKTPIVGICRGHQLLNAYLGAKLVMDIPKQVGKKVKHRKKETFSSHKVTIETPSEFASLTSEKSDMMVKSAHHQAVKKETIHKELRVIASAEDGIVEGTESISNSSLPKILTVQWHPERMDWKHPLSYAVGLQFKKNLGSK